MSSVNIYILYIFCIFLYFFLLANSASFLSLGSSEPYLESIHCFTLKPLWIRCHKCQCKMCVSLFLGCVFSVSDGLHSIQFPFWLIMYPHVCLDTCSWTGERRQDNMWTVLLWGPEFVKSQIFTKVYYLFFNVHLNSCPNVKFECFCSLSS